MFRKIAVVLILLFLTLPLAAEYLFLTDGSIIEGRILSETRTTVTFRAEEDKKVTRYPRSEVMRVLYTRVNMSRVYVQMRTGENYRAYMVDEDRDTYTFRYELYEPEEFKVNRVEVLFMSDRNPTALNSGEIGLDSVELEWLPSFERMRHYNVYYKKKGEDYGDPRRSRNERHVLRGLESNTEYTVRVTGYAGSGDETGPSNEITFRTENHPPGHPPNFKQIVLENRDIELKWDEATDPDGEVVLYRIYGRKDGEEQLIAETKNTRYTVKADAGYTRMQVKAVDDMGAESGSAVSRFDTWTYSFSFTGGVIYPMGNFADLAGMGYGGSINFTKHNMFMPGIDMGVSAGFYYLTGVENKEEKLRETYRSFFVPVGLNVGYRIKPLNTLSLVPYMTAGFALWDISYKTYNPVTLETKDETRRELGPAGGAGLAVEYKISERTALRLVIEQGLLLKSGILDYPYTRFETGMAIRF